MLDSEFDEKHRIIGKITPEGREYRVIPASESLPEGWDEASSHLDDSEQETIEEIDKMVDDIFKGFSL